jgi:hypothetical protein
LSAVKRVAQPLGSLESGRPGTTFTTLSNRGLTHEQPFCDRLLREDEGGFLFRTMVHLRGNDDAEDFYDSFS